MLMSFSARTVQTSSTPSLFNWLPKIGISVDWAGMTYCLELQAKSLHLGVDEARKSKLERLKFLPRTSFTFKINNLSLETKTTPLSEALTNLKGKELTWPALVSVVDQQMKEIKTSTEIWNKLSKTGLAKTPRAALLS